MWEHKGELTETEDIMGRGTSWWEFRTIAHPSQGTELTHSPARPPFGREGGTFLAHPPTTGLPLSFLVPGQIPTRSFVPGVTGRRWEDW